ncbi:hypothetical protein FB475_0794 [Kribbella jejuensis]|uniref:Uncharacterized protein n=1 Tax=Kribbella jejuensis TaxID=236068 RepID=A0A542EMY6_9ACTN|nr:hypothetical protein FB475_0794 [Kribbella jejuensis]
MASTESEAVRRHWAAAREAGQQVRMGQWGRQVLGL